MAATTQEEILSGILPRVSIEKITLSNPNVGGYLNVTVELNIKEVLDNNFFGSWFEEINIKKYILIDVVQSMDPQVTEALSFSNDMIQLCNLSRMTSFATRNDIRVRALSYISGKTKVSDLLNLLQTKTRTNRLSLSQDSAANKNIKEYPSYTNSDGQKVYEVSYKTTFLADTNQEHLAYFAVCSIDLQALCSDLNIDYDIAESFEENGRVVSEIVIENFKIAGYSYVYVDENGVAWSGPIHQNENGQWRSGDDETPDSINLSRVTVSNTKIQDFRNFAEIERMFLDFNQQYDRSGKPTRNSFNLENTLRDITKIQSVDLKADENQPEFTQLLASIDSFGNIKFLFGVEFINVLKNYSKFSKLFYSNNQTFKTEAISNTKILDLKLYRRRIKNNISANGNSTTEYQTEKMDENEPDDLIFQTKDISWKNFININNEKASIRESDLIVPNDNDYIRYFTGADKTFKNLTDGIYQYYVEFEIEDGILDLVQEQIDRLSLARNKLSAYYNRVSKPTMRKFLLESQDPHIDSPSEYSDNSVITDYGYDIVSNKLSRELITNLIRENGGIDSMSAPWIDCASIFVSALDIFSESIQTDEDRRRMTDSLYLFLNPNSTNPSSISKIIELIDYFIASLSKTFDINLQNSNSSVQVSPLSSRTNRSFKVVKYFNEIFDSNSLNNYNIDYLSTSVGSTINEDGLTSLDRNKLSERISNEMLKFFNTQNPNINFNNVNDNTESIKYSFLTPARLDLRDRTIIFSDFDLQSVNASQNKKLQNFYDTTNQFEKAVSIYADILNFKLDVNGKNRQTISSIQQDRTNLNSSERFIQRQREALETSRKISDLFSDYANLTVGRFKTTDFSTVSGNSNIKSLNNFMSSLSSGAVRARQTNNRVRSNDFSNNTNNIISNSAFDYVKELASKNINDIKIEGNIVKGFYGTFTSGGLIRIPNQIRALIFKPQNQLSTNIVNNLDYTGDFSTYIRNKTINYFNFEMIVEIEYLSGFQKISGTDQINLNNPIWTTLNKEYIDSFTEEKEILCRLKPFQNLKLQITALSEIQKKFYDKYFIIKTTQLTTPPVSQFVDLNLSVNPAIQNLIDSFSRNFPGIRITESANFIQLPSMIPSNIQIIRTSSGGNREIIDIKNITDIVAKDINKNIDIKVGKPITPSSAVVSAHALSLGVQEVNINNNFRSSNLVSGRNLGNRMGRSFGRSSGTTRNRM